MKMDAGEGKKNKMSEKLVFYVDVDEIIPDPDQPRQSFNEDDISSLAFTIESQGQINPIEINGDNRIVTGEIRWRAVKKAVENNPDSPELRLVKCVRWSGSPEKRFERQVIENLHHHSLIETDRDKAIVRLWGGGEYPTQQQLAKAVGLSRQAIEHILKAYAFRESAEGMPAAGVSNRAILDTEGLEEKTRVKILEAVAEEKINAQDIRELRKVAQSSDALLEKTLTGQISVERAVEAAETVSKIESKGVALSGAQKQRLADKVAEDERLIEKYEDDILARVQRTMTAPPDTRDRVAEPIGRTSPVNNIIRVKDEINNNFRRYLGNCNVNERNWARRLLTEIHDEVESLLKLISNE